MAALEVDPHEYVGLKCLWLSVLLQAFRDLESPRNFENRGGRVRKAAIQWFNSNKVGTGSFLWICRMLNLNSDYLKRASLVHCNQGAKYRKKRVYTTVESALQQ